ncbi:hypothetical protein HIM_04841 [Hirsutella minnesotensis 3608]|uniref:Uncharacterized protein n=1 Tax=Hirsutella minnesotensis 3608 TaxID=1043627 RepID=A0A0F8A5P4_9HYPO|nr:hypothetical protein HIM_04841 [Hirsutella minnesotensis 3608]
MSARYSMIYLPYWCLRWDCAYANTESNTWTEEALAKGCFETVGTPRDLYDDPVVKFPDNEAISAPRIMAGQRNERRVCHADPNPRCPCRRGVRTQSAARSLHWMSGFERRKGSSPAQGLASGR